MNLSEFQKLLRYDPETGLFWWLPREEKSAGDARVNRLFLDKPAGSPNSSGYVHIKVLGRLYKAHRLAWLFVHGEWPSQQLDHINLDRSDNRIQNLRLVTKHQNGYNRRVYRCNKIGMKGVRQKSAGSFQAAIRIDGKLVYLGSFPTAEAAAAAYDSAAMIHHGEFARCNAA